MRQNEEVQKKIGEVDISEIVIDLTCRDEVPKLLMGLKYIYCNPEIKDKIFKIFEEMIPDKKEKNRKKGDEYMGNLCDGNAAIELQLGL